MENKEKRDKVVHIAFSENELNNIDKYCKDSNSTRSNFIRNSIYEKIRRIDNPNIFNGIGLGPINQELLEKLINNQEKQEKLNKIIEEKLNVIDQIYENLSILEKEKENGELARNEQIVIEILKEHKHLKPLKLMKLSGLPSYRIYDVISNSKLFKINVNGEVELID